MSRDVAGCRFLILHGWQNRRPAGHWQRWLAGALTRAGCAVDYPALPEPDEPRLADWVRDVVDRLESRAESPLTVVCHSLACLVWLHAVATDAVPAPVDRVLLVAPPSSRFVLANPEIAEFAAPPVTTGRMADAARVTRVVASDDDPCCPEGAAVAHANTWELPCDVVPGAGHFTPESGYGEWPSLLAWCRGASEGRRIGPGRSSALSGPT